MIRARRFLRLLPLSGPVLSTSSWTLPIALYLAAIEDDLAVHEGGRHSRGSSLSARSSGFLSFFKYPISPPAGAGRQGATDHLGDQVSLRHLHFVRRRIQLFRTHLVLLWFYPALSLVETNYVDFM